MDESIQNFVRICLTTNAFSRGRSGWPWFKKKCFWLCVHVLEGANFKLK
jgi:hypothetical protein